MSDFDSFLKEQFEQEGVRREYYRLDPFYHLADQLVLLRKQRGLTQKELAEKAGTTQAVISRLENVSVRASLETVVRLAEALDAVVELKLEPMEEMQAASEDNAQEKPVEKPCNEEKAVDVSEPEARYRIQCTEIRLVSSELRPLDPEKEKQGESRFTFKTKVDVQGNMAYRQLQTQVDSLMQGWWRS